MKNYQKQTIRLSLLGGAAAVLTAGLAMASPGDQDKAKDKKGDRKGDTSQETMMPKDHGTMMPKDHGTMMPKDHETMKSAKAKAERKAKTVGKRKVSLVIKNWPAEPKAAVNDLIKKYGQPNELTASLAIWHDNGPWKYTMVSKEMTDHNFPKPHKDFVKQVIAYDVPTDKFDELAAYDGSVVADRTRGHLSARCDQEAMNILALNLANEIIKGKQDVQQARLEYARAVASVGQGEAPESTQKIQFQVPKQAGDPDEAVMNQVKISER